MMIRLMHNIVVIKELTDNVELSLIDHLNVFYFVRWQFEGRSWVSYTESRINFAFFASRACGFLIDGNLSLVFHEDYIYEIRYLTNTF